MGCPSNLNLTAAIAKPCGAASITVIKLEIYLSATDYQLFSHGNEKHKALINVKTVSKKSIRILYSLIHFNTV